MKNTNKNLLNLGISSKSSYRDVPSMSGCSKSGSKECGAGMKNG